MYLDEYGGSALSRLLIYCPMRPRESSCEWQINNATKHRQAHKESHKQCMPIIDFWCHLSIYLFTCECKCVNTFLFSFYFKRFWWFKYNKIHFHTFSMAFSGCTVLYERATVTLFTKQVGITKYVELKYKLRSFLFSFYVLSFLILYSQNHST